MAWLKWTEASIRTALYVLACHCSARHEASSYGLCLHKKNPDAYCIAVSLDEGTTDPQFELPSTFPNYPKVANPVDNHMCVVAPRNCEAHANIATENADAYPYCILDMDVDNRNSRMTKINDETVENLKFEEVCKAEGPLTGSLQRVLQRQISLPVGNKLVQLLMKDRLVLPKFNCTDKSAAERLHETPTNRSRKYKRSTSFNTSFNSRKVVILFSVLSSLGTMVLIYLTLRVRQMGDNYLHT